MRIVDAYITDRIIIYVTSVTNVLQKYAHVLARKRVLAWQYICCNRHGCLHLNNDLPAGKQLLYFEFLSLSMGSAQILISALDNIILKAFRSCLNMKNARFQRTRTCIDWRK